MRWDQAPTRKRQTRWETTSATVSSRTRISGMLCLLIFITLQGASEHHPDSAVIHEEDPPGRPVAECWAVEYPNTVQCSWKLKRQPLLNTTFITTYWYGMSSKETQKECIQSPLKPNSCTISEFEMFSTTPYVLNVTAVTPLGSASTLYPFIVEEIIKPDPPENVTVSPIHGQTNKLRVQWDPPKSWPLPQYFPLKYMIHYKRAGGRAFVTRGPYLQTSVVLTGIWPRMTHTVQVNAKDLVDGGEASDWSSMVSATPWMKH